MQLVDKTARVLAQAQGCPDWDGLSPETRQRFRSAVRAILEALRDPDTAMLEAGAEIIRNVRGGETEAAYIADAGDAWRYMIDVLIGEAP